MYEKEMRPLELLRSFDKDGKFVVSEDEFFERLLVSRKWTKVLRFYKCISLDDSAAVHKVIYVFEMYFWVAILYNDICFKEDSATVYQASHSKCTLGNATSLKSTLEFLQVDNIY